MWALNNSTPFAAERSWGRDKDGVHEWLVAVRATFDIKPDGSLALSAKQSPPLLVPEYNGEDGKSSIRYDTDLVSLKPTTDIIVNGSAYAPGGKPSKDFKISLRVNDVYKELKVVGNRTWKKSFLGTGKSGMEPVVQVPIVYERAFGGMDLSNPDPKKQSFEPRNPVGCGMVPAVDQALPNFEYPGMSFKSAPAGFGVIASYWSPRVELNGTYDDAWKKSKYPLLPNDWDRNSLLCSPPDQRPPAHLRGGEEVELVNLTPGGLVRFVLPSVHLKFRTLIDGKKVDHEDQLATVIIEPDFPRVIMVYQTMLPVHNEVDYLEETTITEKRRLR